ncbi:transcriptional regulator [Pontibacillus litoralis JSM 072002]|uniref:Transcriptional regulator n=2 Tax=Pontibacillus TaxID=289201 RepID=A0A0A5GD54_9BACI|nr:transcriptional regulator [Pontibacillus litoralis JSM 072002]
MTKTSTKQKVMDAASYLFFTKGYNGTSVRDIASKANVNVSLISYHFKSKQGLLEYLMVHYFEKYMEIFELIDNDCSEKRTSKREKLVQIIEAIIQYKQRNYQFTCFINRELTLDNTLIREMMVTYIAKERHYIYEALYQCMHVVGVSNLQIQYLYVQLQGMLMTPFIMPYEMREHVLFQHSHDFFIKKYADNVVGWLDYILEQAKHDHCKRGVM